MDISHQKFTINTSWEPYNIILSSSTISSMEDHNNIALHHDHDHHHHHHAAPACFDYNHQWPQSNYYHVPINIQAHETSNSSPVLPSPPLLGGGSAAADQEPPPVDDQEDEELGAMKEMMFKIAAMQPVDIDPATIRKPRRRNVRISDDPQSVAARHRRERISEKIRILQRLVPGGTKMDTASMLDEAIRYVKFLKRQIRILQASGGSGGGGHHPSPCVGIPAATSAAAAYLFGGNGGDVGGGGDDHHPMF